MDEDDFHGRKMAIFRVGERQNCHLIVGLLLCLRDATSCVSRL